MPILDAGNVAAKQAGALFDVALGEFLFLAHFAEAVTNNHCGIISLRRMEGKPYLSTISDSVKRHLPIEYAADLTPVVAAKEARASWNAPGWQKPLDFSSRKEYGGMASGRTPGKIVRRVEG